MSHIRADRLDSSEKRRASAKAEVAKLCSLAGRANVVESHMRRLSLAPQPVSLLGGAEYGFLNVFVPHMRSRVRSFCEGSPTIAVFFTALAEFSNFVDVELFNSVRFVVLESGMIGVFPPGGDLGETVAFFVGRFAMMLQAGGDTLYHYGNPVSLRTRFANQVGSDILGVRCGRCDDSTMCVASAMSDGNSCGYHLARMYRVPIKHEEPMGIRDYSVCVVTENTGSSEPVAIKPAVSASFDAKVVMCSGDGATLGDVGTNVMGKILLAEGAPHGDVDKLMVMSRDVDCDEGNTEDEHVWSREIPAHMDDLNRSIHRATFLSDVAVIMSRCVGGIDMTSHPWFFEALADRKTLSVLMGAYRAGVGVDPPGCGCEKPDCAGYLDYAYAEEIRGAFVNWFSAFNGVKLNPSMEFVSQPHLFEAEDDGVVHFDSTDLMESDEWYFDFSYAFNSIVDEKRIDWCDKFTLCDDEHDVHERVSWML